MTSAFEPASSSSSEAKPFTLVWATAAFSASGLVSHTATSSARSPCFSKASMCLDAIRPHPTRANRMRRLEIGMGASGIELQVSGERGKGKGERHARFARGEGAVRLRGRSAPAGARCASVREQRAVPGGRRRRPPHERSEPAGRRRRPPPASVARREPTSLPPTAAPASLPHRSGSRRGYRE